MLQMIALVLLSIWACIQNLLYLNYLPEQVAIHFGPDGVADNWLGRGKAAILMVVLQVVLPWILVAVAKGIRFLPGSAINMPNREYWLVPERRDSAFAYIEGWLASLAIAESILISVMNHLSFVANRTGQPLNTQLALLSVGVFLATTVIMVIKMYSRFSIPRNSSQQLG